MNKLLRFFLILLLVLSGVTGIISRGYGQGGMDVYGYRWIDSKTTGGPSFKWIDISKTGTRATGLSDDNYIGPIPIGFPFKYYWSEFSELYIGTNGYVMFGRGMNVASIGDDGFLPFPTSGPSSTPNNYIGMFTADLTMTDVNHAPLPDAKVMYQTIGDSLFVVSFINVPFWTNDNALGYSGTNTFQLILHRNTNNITLNYLKNEGPFDSSYGGRRFCSLGMENITGSIGLQFLQARFPDPNYTILVIAPKQSTLQKKDIQVDWIMNPENGGSFASSGGRPIRTTAAVRNTGTVGYDAVADPSQIIRVTRRVFDYMAGNSIIPALTEVVPVSKLAVNEVRNITFSKPIPTNVLGNMTNYVITVSVEAAGDEYPGNNDLMNELMIADTTLPEIELGYDRFTVLGSLETWAREDGVSLGLELGTYIKPPFYPCNLTGVSVGMVVVPNGLAPDTLLGFYVKVYDDNGPNGGPGTLIDSIMVDGSTYQDNYDKDANTITAFAVEARLKRAFYIGDGGVYISWKEIVHPDPEYNRNRSDLLAMEGGIGVPVSYRSYEITGGIWAPYRERYKSDPILRAIISKVATRRPAQSTSDASFTVYPNPASDLITISHPTASEYNYTLSDVTGRVLLSGNVNGRSTTLNTAILPAGVYTLSLNYDQQTVYQKIILSRE